MGEGTFQRHQIRNLLDDAKGRGVALRVAADLTEWGFSQTTATVAATDALGGSLQGGYQRGEFGGLFDQKVQGNPFRGTMSESGEEAKELTNFLERRGHGRD